MILVAGPSFTPGEATQLVCCVDPQNLCKGTGCMGWRWRERSKPVVREISGGSNDEETVWVEVGFCGRALFGLGRVE